LGLEQRNGDRLISESRGRFTHSGGGPWKLGQHGLDLTNPTNGGKALGVDNVRKNHMRNDLKKPQMLR
jgi:hypothetical protein